MTEPIKNIFDFPTKPKESMEERQTKAAVKFLELVDGYNLKNCPKDYESLKLEAIYLAGFAQYSTIILAQRCSIIHEKQLYLKDLNEDGTVKYKDFKSWVEGELSISRQTVYKYMDLYKYFGHIESLEVSNSYSKLIPLLPLLKSDNKEIPKRKIIVKYCDEIEIKSARKISDEALELKYKYGLLETPQEELLLDPEDIKAIEKISAKIASKSSDLMKHGEYPCLISVYDEEEAKILQRAAVKLRDELRSKR